MKICITILLVATNLLISRGQTADELLLLRENCCNSANIDNTGRPASGRGVVHSLFTVYKVFISSQDFHSCVFTPSCSEYAVQSIDNLGFFRGLFDTADRLTRCHGFRPGDYTIDQDKKKLFDPVKNIRYENP